MQYHASLGERWRSECSCFSFSSNVILLGLCDPVGALTPIPGVSQCSLGCGQLLGGLFVRGTEAGDDLSCHCDHITPESLFSREHLCVMHWFPEDTSYLRSFCFRIFLNLDCKLCWIPSEIQIFRRKFFFFFVSPFSWCHGWHRQISLQSLSAWRFISSVLSHYGFIPLLP